MTTYRLFPSTNGPSSPVSYSGPFSAGVGFEVTTGGVWFEGYWWWVCPSGQPTAAQTFALWQVYQGSSASIISAATVTSGTLTAGQWNYVPLANPIMLSVGGGANFAHADVGGTACYIACTAFTGDFPDTDGQYGSGGPYAAGITNGPLTAFSSPSGSLVAPFGTAQGVFSTNGSVTSEPPFGGSGPGANFWMDVQVSDTAPSGYSGSYRIWPNMPTIPGGISNDMGQQTFGTEFWLSESCELDNIWFWSPPGVTVLPSRCGIFSVATQTEVSGTDKSPSWSGAAGSGWVSCSYSSSGVVLPAGKYKTCVYMDGGSKVYQEDVDYFGTGPGANNFVNGPITVPNVANASSCISGSGPDKGQTVTGNSTYQDGPWSYPDTFDSDDNGETRWIDVEVTPSSGGGGGGGSGPPPPSVVNSGAFLIFFP